MPHVQRALAAVRPGFFSEIPDGLSSAHPDWLLPEDSMMKHFEQRGAVGRRSRLRLSGKSLLLTGLFFPASGQYEEEK